MPFRSATCADTSFRMSKEEDKGGAARPSCLRVLPSEFRASFLLLRSIRIPINFRDASLLCRGSSFVAMAGGMDVHKNKYIEDWGTARENLEKTFRFNRRNITLAIIFGIAVPLLTYQGVTGEFHKQDVAAEQPRRKFLGSQ